MSSSKIIIRNALFSYGRTLISAALTLFSSRWILADLGASDFGVYGLAGGLLFFVSFISSILSQGTGRYLAFAIGTGSKESVMEWFNTALNVFFCLPLVLIPIGWGIGEIMVRFVLKIDPSRVHAALWVFRCSLVSFFAVLIATPFLSLLTSKQMIHVAASLMLVHSFALFGIAYFLPVLPGDHLVSYSASVMCSLILLQVLYVCVCRQLCPEARIMPGFWWNWKRIKTLARYSGWLCVGTVGTVLNVQGQSFLLNLMRGTSANAGAGVASSLSGQMQTLANAFLLAINPEVVRREGANNHKMMVGLARRSSKLGMALLLMVGLPLFCECEYILKIWLKNPPPYAAFFTRLAILSSLFYKMAVGHRMCFQAVERIKNQQLVEFSVFAGTTPIIAIVFWATHSVMAAFSLVVVMQLVYFLATAYLGSRQYEWPWCVAVKEILIPSVACFLLGLFLFFVERTFLGEGNFLRLVITTLVLTAHVSLFFIAFAFSEDERAFLKSCFIGLKSRICKVWRFYDAPI